MLILHALTQDLESRLAAAVSGHGVTLVRASEAEPDGPAPQDVGLVITGASLSCPAARIARLPALRGIVAPGSGTDSIDLAAATAAGIPIAHAPTPQNINGMAEGTILLMLAARYDLPAAMARLNGPRPRHAQGLAGATVGLIGLGRIARAVARRLQAWDVRLLGCARTGTSEAPPGVEMTDLGTLLRDSDIVSLHAAPAAGEGPLLGPAEFSMMKRGATLINTARGALIDERALIEALDKGRPANAALDVFATEPLPPDSPLRHCPRLILTPHCVGQTREGHEALAEALIANVVRLLEGRVPLYPRNDAARALHE